MYTPKGFKKEINELFDDLAETAVTYGLKNEIEERKMPDSTSEMNSELTKKVDFFFNNFDHKLYNLETMKLVKQNILDKLPECAGLELELYKENLKLDTKQHYAWLGYGFGKGAVITGVIPAVALSFVFPPLMPVCALSGFWGGVWGVDTQDRQFTEKYDSFVSKRKDLIEGVLNV